MQALIDFFGVNDFIPHGYCLSWNPALLWTTVLSDSIMVLAYGSTRSLSPISSGSAKICNTLAVPAFLQWIHSDLRQHPPDLGRDRLAPAVLAGCVYKGTGCRGRCGTVFAIWWVIPRALNCPARRSLDSSAAQRSMSAA